MRRNITAEEAAVILDKRFSSGTPKRSEPYMIGFRHQLERCLGGVELCPYEQGSVEFDAYFAGADSALLNINCYLLEKEGSK